MLKFPFKISLNFLVLSLVFSSFLVGEPLVDVSYPVIENLTLSDPVFKQWQNRLRQSLKKGQESSLVFFAYQVKLGDTFVSLSSKSNGWQAAVATLNGFSNIEDLKEGEWLLLPSQKGVFIYDPPLGELQDLMVASREKEVALPINVWRQGALHKAYFFSFEEDSLAGDFQSSERYFFLDSGFSFPLRKFVLSSGFGWRKSPISGAPSYHKGIDLAAPFGTIAYPAKTGTVIKVDYNGIYGHYVVVRHANGYESLYGHFQKVLVKVGESVDKNKGMGEVGDTGLSTGPHLHFEIYKQGQLQNPSALIDGKR